MIAINAAVAVVSGIVVGFGFMIPALAAVIAYNAPPFSAAAILAMPIAMGVTVGLIAWKDRWI